MSRLIPLSEMTPRQRQHADTYREYMAIKPLLRAGYRVSPDSRRGTFAAVHERTGERFSIGGLPPGVDGVRRAAWLFDQRMGGRTTRTPHRPGTRLHTPTHIRAESGIEAARLQKLRNVGGIAGGSTGVGAAAPRGFDRHRGPLVQEQVVSGTTIIHPPRGGEIAGAYPR